MSTWKNININKQNIETETSSLVLFKMRMDANELLRLKQISGLTALFKDKDFSQSWE